MLRRLSKTILLVMLVGVLAFSLAACNRSSGNRGFNAEVVIDGVETAEHHGVFRVVNDYNGNQLDWEDEAEYDEGSFKAELTGLEKDVELELVIDNEIIDDDYIIVEPENGIIKVNADNNSAEFLVELDYEAELFGIRIDGPEKIYASQRQDELAKYDYKAELFDQYDNAFSGEVEWSLEGEPAGVEIVDNTIEVAWDAKPGEFLLKATAVDDNEVYASLNVLVVNPVRLEVGLSIKHNFPQSKVDNTKFLSMDHERLKTNIDAKPLYKTTDIEEINELIIKFKQDVSHDEINSILSGYEYELLDKVKSKNLTLVEFYNDDLKVVIDELKTNNEIEYIEGNDKAFVLATNIPNDELYPYQWHYPQIRLPQAWSITTGSRDVRIAVLDTGINAEHPDLQGQVDLVNGYDFINKNNDATDINWHGTHVAGTIGARTNNNQGVAGVMWDVELLPVKVLENDTGGLWGIAAGIYYAAGLHENLPESFYNEEDLPENSVPVDIINMSFGTTSNRNIIKEAVEAADKEEIIMVAAAGNWERDTLLYPANYPEVISVGATDLNYPDQPNVTNYSHTSNNLDIVAPGGDTNVDTNKNNNLNGDGVLSTINGREDYSIAQGTSMAAPHVTGVIGLMLSEGISSQEIRGILHRTAMNLGENNFSSQYGYGLINAYWAVNQVENIQVSLYRDDEGFEKVDEQNVSLDSKATEFEIRKSGQYKIEALVDVQRTGLVNLGDYVVSQYFDVEKLDGESVLLDLELEEVGE